MISLSHDELHSPLWQKLQEDCASRLSELRKGNDKDMSETETAKQRGRIAELKRIIAIGEVKEAIEIE